MADNRLIKHPILAVEPFQPVAFYWKEKKLIAKKDEALSSALYSQGIKIFGHHPRDGAPQGIFCANGQCAQCLVRADGKTVKACMTPVREGMRVAPLEGLPLLPEVSQVPLFREIPESEVPVLILGGGPAGLSTALELANQGIKTLVVDDKPNLGGKLVLQTHKFFGSYEAVYAGRRGIDIALLLEQQVLASKEISVWKNSTALAVFSDRKVGILKDGREYRLIQPQVFVVATGAREKSLLFKGNTLPGVYGAGAFQTILNRDLVRPAQKLFIIGGGNVGLIVGYHALQAGIEVVGVAEAAEKCGGYRVHRDKLSRLGVPIHTSHTILSANGKDQVESVSIKGVDKNFKPLPGTEKTFLCDTVLIAVGLDPVNEFYHKAREFGIPVLAAGDAEQIAEASAAIFSGKIKGQETAAMVKKTAAAIPPQWQATMEILASPPGADLEQAGPTATEGCFPVFHCSEKIPCNPCASVCPLGLIHIDLKDIRELPEFSDLIKKCSGCERCLTICPGLAMTLVDFRKNRDFPSVSVACEFSCEGLKQGDELWALDREGNDLGKVEIERIRYNRDKHNTNIIKVKANPKLAVKIAGLRIHEPWSKESARGPEGAEAEEAMLCRCERISAGEVRELIRQGVTDFNELKAKTRLGMGACGSKSCGSLIQRIFQEQGISTEQSVNNVSRPLFTEVPLGVFAGISEDNRDA